MGSINTDSTTINFNGANIKIATSGKGLIFADGTTLSSNTEIGGGGSSNLQQVVDLGNVTANTLLLENTGKTIVSSGNIESNIITTIIRFQEGSELPDGQGVTLENAANNGNTISNVIQFSNGFVVGSNLVVDEIGTNVIDVTGRIGATLFVGDGGLLSNTAKVDDMTSNSTRISNFENAINVDTSTGYIGLGRTSPYARLEVGSSTGAISSAASRYFKYNYNIGSSTSAFTSVSIFAVEDIITNQWIVSHAGTMSASDRRIKSNIFDISDTFALEKLRLLQPKTYTYKDVVSRGSDSVIGFIAQDVQETLPEASGIRTDFIPNIYELANVSQTNIITFTKFNTASLESNSTTIKLKTIDDTDKIVTISGIIDAHSLQTNEDLSEFEQVFVYGQKVDDFVFIKKDAIFTITTAAVQELDKKQRLLEERILALEQQINSS